MRTIAIVLMLFSTMFIYHCDTKTSGNKTTADASKKVSVPPPDLNTFFPLIAQSAWYYEQFMEGTLEPGNLQIDSVVEVEKTDTGVTCKMVRISGEVQENFVYLVNANGIVSLVDTINGTMHYCALFPMPEEQIGEMRYSKFLNDKNSVIRLETSDFENATEKQQMEWQAKIFEKGIGLTSFGGSSLSMMLTAYHIGTEPVKSFDR